jgi:predicted lactoylglutathione lyase
MPRMIVISLPVRDLDKSKNFYSAIGATLDSRLSDETAALMVFSEHIQVMLLTHEKWATFTHKQIPDAHKASEVALSLSCDSRAAVNDMMDAIKKVGGAVDVNPVQDHGFMFGRDFEDPDGHAWGAVWMDVNGVVGQIEE